MKPLHRGAAILAAALIAGGLTTVTTPAAQADSDLLVLTEKQADTLAERLQVDVYGDAATAVDPQHAAADPVAEPGSATAAGPLTVTTRTSLEGAQGMARTIPLAGSGSDFLDVHTLGLVQRLHADGRVVWRRDNRSFYEDWRVSPIRAYQTEPYPARIVAGFNAVSAFTPASDDGITTGDLTGDGVADLVFSASVGAAPYRPMTSPGSTLTTGTFVTILDGATGSTVWSKLYAAAYNVTLVGRTLVVADSPATNINAPSGSKPTLTGTRFTYAGGALTPSSTWSYEADATTGASWGSLLALPGNRVAASWNQGKVSATSPTSGHTLVLDVRDGSVRWESSDDLYSRQFQLDAHRDRLVAIEQADYRDGVRYQLATYDLADGRRRASDDRENVLPLALAVDDVAGRAAPEYVVSEGALTPDLYVNLSTVRAVSGLNTQLWSRTVKRDPATTLDGPMAFGLEVVDGDVVASYRDDRYSSGALNRSSSRLARLAVLDGDTGRVRWERRGAVASQMWAQPTRADGVRALRTVDVDQNIRTYRFANGRQTGLVPLPAPLSSGVVTDVNGDAKGDLVAGGQSNGVWAYDGGSLVAGAPKVLWRAVVPGQVHDVVAADTTGDGLDEIVVAADSATVVLDAATGKTLATIPGGDEFVWTVTAGDVDGDGKAEIVVPTDQVRVYRGSGSMLWSYAAPETAGDVVFAEASVGDGRVYAEYATRDAFDTRSGAVAGVALNGRTGGVRWVADPHPEGATGETFAIPMRAATFASPDIPYADGHAVAMTWNAPSATSPQQVWAEIRDGRTGEVLKTVTIGGSWTLGNWFADQRGAHQVGVAAVRTFGADGAVTTFHSSSQFTNARTLNGPGGGELLVAGGASGMNIYDASALGQESAATVASVGILGSRELVTGDLDGDGTDEIVSLNFDETGTDRMAGLEEGGYYTPYTAIRSLTVLSLSGS